MKREEYMKRQSFKHEEHTKNNHSRTYNTFNNKMLTFTQIFLISKPGSEMAAIEAGRLAIHASSHPTQRTKMYDSQRRPWSPASNAFVHHNTYKIKHNDRHMVTGKRNIK